MKNSMRSMLQNHDTIKWMNKRFKDRVPLKYRTTPEEYNMHLIIQSIFQKFDEDGSSTSFNRLTRAQGSTANVHRKWDHCRI